MWPEQGSNPQRWDDERFRALKNTILNHSATRGLWNMSKLQTNSHLWCWWVAAHSCLKGHELHNTKVPFLVSRLNYDSSHCITKPTKWPLCPAKTQINLGRCLGWSESLLFRQGWSESLLFVWRSLGSSADHWVHREDSDQTGRIPRMIRVCPGRTGQFVGFVML